ncbi:MHYT domain-containing protein [Pseudoalteromonas sp. GB43]
MIDYLKLHFISPSLTSSQTIPAQYDSLLVCLSVLTAVFASYISFLLSAKIKSSQLRNESLVWTLLASCFLGIGIWGMHFVGMLAYKLPIAVEYNITVTLILYFAKRFCKLYCSFPHYWAWQRASFSKCTYGGWYWLYALYWHDGNDDASPHGL